MKLSIKQAKQWLTKELDGVTDSPVFEATELLIFVTNEDKNSLRLGENKILSPKQILKFKRCLKKRKKGVPLQYILGEWEFYSAPFLVGSGVLIPRADSELLVDLALKEISEKSTPKVFDLCSGSGAIGISVAINCKLAEVTLVEKSKKAFKYLLKNSKLNKVKVKAVCADISNWESDTKADLILCNPPYITRDEMRDLQKEVKKEPAMALFGGDDGLKFYRLLSIRARELLVSGGKIFMEIGFKQGPKVSKIFKDSGYINVEVIKDLSGNDRVVTAQIK